MGLQLGKGIRVSHEAIADKKERRKVCKTYKNSYKSGRRTEQYTKLKSKNMIKLLTECVGLLLGLGLISVI